VTGVAELVGLPTSFEASIGNGLAGYFALPLAEAGVLRWSDSTVVGRELVESVVPSVAAWQRFAAVLERLDVFE
jgi:hypothetical protein